MLIVERLCVCVCVCVCVCLCGGDRVCENSELSSQFRCEPKTALKIKPINSYRSCILFLSICLHQIKETFFYLVWAFATKNIDRNWVDSTGRLVVNLKKRRNKSHLTDSGMEKKSWRRWGRKRKRIEKNETEKESEESREERGPCWSCCPEVLHAHGLYIWVWSLGLGSGGCYQCVRSRMKGSVTS